MSYLKRKRKQGQKTVPILTEKTNFTVTEAYKAARTNLRFTLQTHSCKRILITSAAPNEGKSTNCCNLAITLALADSKVLIVDCDLRKPIIHKCFNRECVPGLSELLAGIKDDLADVVQNTEYQNLNIICGGTVPPNPTELLSSAAMVNLINTLSEEYDYILLDSPPVNLVTDAVVLSAITDGVVLVVRQGKITHPELSHALANLKFANAKVLGIIRNGIEPPRSYKYKKYSKMYGNYNRSHE